MRCPTCRSWWLRIKPSWTICESLPLWTQSAASSSHPELCMTLGEPSSYRIKALHCRVHCRVHCRLHCTVYNYPSCLGCEDAPGCSIPELVALLDSHSAFPSGPFASDEALAALQRLGLRTAVSTATLLDSARSIAEMATKNQAAARARFKPSSKWIFALLVVPPSDSGYAVAIVMSPNCLI